VRERGWRERQRWTATLLANFVLAEALEGAGARTIASCTRFGVRFLRSLLRRSWWVALPTWPSRRLRLGGRRGL
jgi:hypothetical protein